MKDTDAFVFNMNTKYTPNNYDYAVQTYPSGFCFGGNILYVRGDTLNRDNGGYCLTGKEYGYNISGDVSPLTNQKERFTCA